MPFNRSSSTVSTPGVKTISTRTWPNGVGAAVSLSSLPFFLMPILTFSNTSYHSVVLLGHSIVPTSIWTTLYSNNTLLKKNDKKTTTTQIEFSLLKTKKRQKRRRTQMFHSCARRNRHCSMSTPSLNVETSIRYEKAKQKERQILSVFQNETKKK